ncbi:MAG TPA: ATP-binding protein [Anaerolineae bacterium]|nr:ATP-binding protein [Anaerolineae bacterium]
MAHEEQDRRPEGEGSLADHGDGLYSGRLRREAEAILNGRAPNLEALTAQALQDLVHEFQVHQIELELQNQALRETQLALELARDDYADLYDRAPVGYVTLGGDGTITRANATAAALLGIDGNALFGKPFRRLVARDNQDDYHFFLVRLSSSGRETDELDLVRGDGTRFRARLEGVVSGVDGEGRPRWRAAVSDITAEHEAREALRLIMEGTASVVGHDFLRAIVRHLARLLNVPYAILGQLDDSTWGRLRTHAVWAGDGWAENFTIDLRNSACAPAAAGQASFCASGLRGRFPNDPFLARWKVESARALPLRDVSGQVRGVLLLLDETAMAVDPHLEPVLTIFAERAAAELARLAAEASSRRFSDEQAALYAVAAALVTSLELEELTRRVLDVIVPLFGAAVGWIVAAGDAGDDPRRAVASRGFGQVDIEPEALAAELEAWPAGTDRLQPRVAVQRDRVPGGLLERAHLSSQVCLPLASHSRVVGWLHLAWYGQRALTDDEESLLLAVGDQVAIGMYNARLYRQARQVDRLRVLTELDLALMGSLDPGEVATIGMQQLSAAMRSFETLILSYASVLDGNDDRVLTPDEGWIQVEASARYHRWREMLETLRQQSRDLPRPRSVYTTAAPWGSQVLVVPIDDDGPLADLILSGSTFADEDIALARAAASRMSQALRNAQLYAEVRALLRRQQESQAQLVHSEKMAALGRLTASLSHEIKNPLQSVLGCLGLLREELAAQDEQEPVGRYLSVANQAILRIRAIVDRMRVAYRRDDEDLVAGDVQPILENVVELTRGELQNRHVTIDRAYEVDLPAVRLNAGQMHQIFLNLILNAADAMPDGGTLTLRTGRGELVGLRREPQPAVRIDVQDTGVGIAAAVQERLFEPFFTTKKDGSGLGLYISQQIVQVHDGEIEVHSREGEGTTMTVWLPIISDEQVVGEGSS